MRRFTCLWMLLALALAPPVLAQQAGTDALTVTCDGELVAVVGVAADGTVDAVLREDVTCRGPLSVVGAPSWSVAIDRRGTAPVVVLRGGGRTWRTVADVAPTRASVP